MPKVNMPERAELHNHLGSAVDPPIMWSIAHRQGIKLPSKDYWDFEDLITIDVGEDYNSVAEVDKELFYWTELVQSSPEAVETSVESVIGGGFRKCNIVVHELRFNPMNRNRGGERDLDHIILAAVRGMDRAILEYPQVKAGLILMMDRKFSFEQNQIILEKAFKYQERGIVGIDIAGPQVEGFNMKEHYKLFKQAKSHGLGLTIHTGEEGNLEEMRDLIKAVSPERIGHGFLAWQDKDLMKLLKKNKTVLELCPTSNLRCGVIDSVEQMKEIYQTLYKNGIKLTINTDGPEMYQTNLHKERQFLIDQGIFTVEQIDEFNQNAIKAAFVK